jgi:hypothetical protein
VAGVIGAVEAALYAKLNVTAVKATAGATGVYNRIAPQSTALPYVVFQWQGGGDENDHPDRSRNLVYTVKALAIAAVAADTIDAACDALLHNGTLTVAGYNVFWLRRDGDVAYSEVDATGQPIYHTGGMYRIRLEAS